MNPLSDYPLNTSFKKIIDNLESIYSKNRHLISFIIAKDQSELTIKIKFQRNSIYNSLPKHIYFFIVIDYLFPQSEPAVYCCTNFTEPTLHDKRNLLHSIIENYWATESSITYILDKIPEFISRVREDCVDKILVYYGEYKIDKLYDVNEFMMNIELDFYKVFQRIEKGSNFFLKERYIVLTDIYFLLFDPIINNKNYARLLFFGDIRQIESFKNSSISSDFLLLEWKSSENNNVHFDLSFYNNIGKFFIENALEKIKKLKNFKVFQEDLSKPDERELDVNSNTEKISLMIKFKEELIEKNYSMNLVKDLMNLYQKIIEVLSAKNDESYKFYIEKLHKILQNKEIKLGLIESHKLHVKRKVSFKISDSLKTKD